MSWEGGREGERAWDNERVLCNGGGSETGNKEADRVCYGGSGFVYLLHFFVSSTVFFTQARVPFGELILSWWLTILWLGRVYIEGSPCRLGPFDECCEPVTHCLELGG